MTARPTLPVTTAPALPAAALATTSAPTGLPATVPGQARRWLAGAMLVTVGLAAGGGATWALTSSAAGDVPGVTSGVGAPPLVHGPLGTLPEAPARGDGTTGSTDGEPT